VVEMSNSEKFTIKKKIFHKMEKYFRLRRLEKRLGLFEKGKPDEEKHLKTYMTAWEGIKPDYGPMDGPKWLE
jgi:hypothetical protein